MSKEMLDILNDLSKKETTELALQVMELLGDNMVKDKEIERLNNDIKILLKENENKEKVIIKQNNIIEELEKYLKEQIQRSWEIEEQCYEIVYNYLQELKEKQ